MTGVDRAAWLVGGGEMAKVIKAKDWSTTPLGPIESWPQSLRTTVSLAQASSWPISIVWGPGHTQIYNDGYWPICGAKHPVAMGQDFRECWASAWPVIGEAYETALSGRSGYLEKMRIFLDRFAFLEETWFTFSFSPISDESGRVGGLFHPVIELTTQMLSERRTQTVRDLALRCTGAKTTQEALELAAGLFTQLDLDVPFTVFYAIDANATRAHRCAHSGISAEAAGPELIDLAHRRSPWGIRDAVRSGAPQLIDTPQLDGVIGPYPELPRQALVLPIRVAGSPSPVAVMVAGVSARLMLTDAYRVFYDLVASTISSALTSARTLEGERRKAEQLAELDRAKTAFFSNVSHEFRTPLTLILGLLEDDLADRTAATAHRERIATAHRNSLRLLKLVNTLLDFSRLEAGRLRAAYEPVDLAAETAQLASGFRAAIEKAGLTLTVDCPPLPERIYVDREMWEKIVLNLLSNAFKYTSTGAIAVAQRWAGDHVKLTVTDTGIGVAAHELPHVFERFHRVSGAWSRSYEGTGIGLALVRELAILLGGTAEMASTEGIGTIATVTLKTGTAHLPREQIAASAMRVSGSIALGFVEEARQWTATEPVATEASIVLAPSTASAHRPRVVVADDNADMRDYVTRLLADHVDVTAVPDGIAALQAVRERIPDLVLSDVMMPRLDGFGLLSALRADPRTHTVPIVLVSARAGAESATEGMDAGADDYLTKPFAARELIARVRTHLALGQSRRAWALELERAYRELEAFSYSVSHDLRAPLRAIDGFAQILLDPQDDIDDARRRSLLTRIHANARRMSSIIDDLLSLSQISSTKLRKAPVDLTAIALRVVGELRARHPARDVDVRVADGLAATCDGRLVTIVLENLLSNAWKFTSKLNHAEIVVEGEPGHVFTVHDNGAGFDMAHSKHLFEPFQRLHAANEFEGTGIGLAIVRRIVERHGGQVWAHGEVGHGATVRFTLEPGQA